MLSELKAMAVFAKVAETGSFRGAASQLNLSPSVISNHITSLEKHIGKALIYRTTRKLSLTAAGEELWPYARQITENAESGLSAVTGDHLNPKGRLRLSVPSDFQYGRVVEDVAAFSIEYPEIAVEIDFTDRRTDLVAEGIDLAARLDLNEDSNLMTTKILDGTRQLFASRGYLAKHKPIKSPADLGQHKLIYSAGLENGIPMTHRNTGMTTLAKIPKHIAANTGYGALRFVEVDMGLACLPGFFASNMIKSDNIVEVLPDWAVKPYGIYLVWPANPGNRSAAKLLTDFLRERIKNYPPPTGMTLAPPIQQQITDDQ